MVDGKKEIKNAFRKSSSRRCIPPRCPEGYTKTQDIHSHPGNDPVPSGNLGGNYGDINSGTAKDSNVQCSIATGYRSSLPNIVQIVEYGQYGAIRSAFYDCENKKFVPKPR